MAKTLHYDFKANPSLTAVTGPTLSITRATDATMKDSDGWLRTVQDGEARFPGAAFSSNLLDYGNAFNNWVNFQSTEASGAEDPFGGTEGWSLNEDGTAGTNHGLRTNSAVVAGHQYLWSVYAKASNRNWIFLQFQTTFFPANAECSFDLANGVLGTVEAGIDDAGIEDVGNGWYRCWMVSTADGTGITDHIRLYIAEADQDTIFDGLSQESLLIYGSMVEDASGAWDSENLNVDSTAWSGISADVTTGQTDPNNGTDAILITGNSSGSGVCGAALDASFVAPTPGRYMFSAYAKAGLKQWVSIWFDNFGVSLPDNTICSFDVGNGVVGASPDAEIVSQGISDEGGGWYRIWCIADLSSDDLAGGVRLYMGDSDGDTTVERDATSTMYFAWPQIERTKPGQTSPSNYQETTSGAVTNYSPSTYIPTTTAAVSSLSGSSDGLLVEEARTNLALYSENTGGETGWTNSASTSTADQTIAPDGSLTGNLVVDDGLGGATGNCYTAINNITYVASSEYTVSFFAKADQSDWVLINHINYAGVYNTWFDLANGAVGSTPGANVNSAGIEDYGNGWYRCWIQFTSDAVDTTGGWRIGPAVADNNGTITRDGTNSIFHWGLQIEAGAFLTSYISTGTGGASVTRNACDVDSTDLTWYDNTGCTFYAAWNRALTGSAIIFAADDGSSNDRWNIVSDGGGLGRVASSAYATSTQFTNQTNTGVDNDGSTSRAAAAYATNDSGLYANGSPDSSPDLVGTMPTGLTEFQIGRAGYNDSDYINGLVEEVRAYDERLGNGTLKLMSEGTFPDEIVQDAGTRTKTLHYNFKDNPSLTDQVAGPDLSITRATTAVMKDSDGWLRTVQDGEARFPGAAFSHNTVTNSDNPDLGLNTTNGSETADAAANPINGTVNAMELYDDGVDTTCRTSQTGLATRGIKVGGEGLWSVYVKKSRANGRWVALENSNVSGCQTWFDLDNGVKGTQEAAVIDAGIEDVGNGWYRLWSVHTVIGASPNFSLRISSADGSDTIASPDGTYGVYVYGPQCENASGAWDSDNIAPDSQGFTAGTWTKTNASVTADSITDPFGGVHGDLVTGTGSTQFRVFDSSTAVLDAGADYFISVYAKAGSVEWLWIQVSSLSGVYGNGSVYFDLTNGVTGTVGSSPVDYGIVDAGNGWYRCWVRIRTTSGDTIGRVSFYGAEGDNDASFADVTGETFYLYGAQFERAKPSQTVPGTYVETTGSVTAAVTNYSPSTYIPTATAAVSSLSGANDGLLVEEARTNICLQSEDFGTTWLIGGLNSVINTDQTIAPDGSLTADQLIDDALGGNQIVGVAQAVTVATATAYTFSAFVKADQLDWCYLAAVSFTTPGNSNAYFDLSNGVKGTVDAGFDDSGIEDYGNGWYRVWVSFTTDATDTSGQVRILVADQDNDPSVDTDGTSSIFVWGAMLEQNVYPSSYISTTTSSETKNADVIETNDVSWYNTDAGTVFYEMLVSYQPEASKWVYSISDGSSSDRIYGYRDGADNLLQGGVSEGASNTPLTATDGVLPFDTRRKATFGYQLDDAAFYVEGTQEGTSSSYVLPVGIDTLGVGQFYAGSTLQLNGLIQEFAYYDSRLPNDTLLDYSLNGLPTGGTLRHLLISKRHNETDLRHNDLTLTHNDVSNRHRR